MQNRTTQDVFPIYGQLLGCSTVLSVSMSSVKIGDHHLKTIEGHKKLSFL